MIIIIILIINDTYIQFPKVYDGEINIQPNRTNCVMQVKGLTDFLLIVITLKKSSV